MPSRGKSSKEGKKKDGKLSVADTDQGKFRIVSEDKSPRSGTSRRQYAETVLQNAEQISANYQHPSPSLQVLGSGRSRGQPVPFYNTTNLVGFGIGRSKGSGRERGSAPPLLRSDIKPIKIVETPDGKYIDMEFMNASVSTNDCSDCDDPTNQVSGYKTTRKTSANSPSGPVHAREILIPSNLLLNNQSVPIYPKRTRDSIHWPDDRKQQSYRLPLPPVTKSSPVPMSPSYSTSANYQVLQRSVQADNRPRWKKGHLIGCGTFGQVYLGFNCESGEMCAMKEVTLYPDDPKSMESARQLSQEIALLSELHHPNIVQYYGSEMVDNNIYIYLEYVSGGSIHKVLQDYGPLGELALRSFAQQILSALAYLHAKNTVHRDVKGANILLQPDGRVKLADFGMAKHISAIPGRMSFKGSPYWIAPEVIRNSNANVSVDIWSLGCTILEMATGKPPWSQYEEVAALFKIGHNKELPPIPDSLSEEGKDFVRKCLEHDPLQRHTAVQLLEHPFVKSYTPSERYILSPELVKATHIATNPGKEQRRNQQFLDPGAIHQSMGFGTVTPISSDHSPKTRRPIAPVGNLLRESQSPRYMSATRLTPILTPCSSSGLSIPTSADSGAIQFHHPRTPQYISERSPPTSLATPSARPSSSPPIASGNVRPCHHSKLSKHRYERLTSFPISSPRVATPTSSKAPSGIPSSSASIAACNVRQGHHPESPKHRLERLTSFPISSPHAAAAGSLAHLAAGSVPRPFHTKSPIKNMHGNLVSMSRHHNSSYSNVPSELANWVSLQRPGELRKHVKFNCR